MSRHVWLDCDPGHDDATAILLAVHAENIHLLGVSTVHGNASAANTNANAARCLHAFGAPASVRVHPGAAQPLLRAARHDPEIHGADGLGGVEGLPAPDSAAVRARIDGGTRAIEGIARGVADTWRAGAGSRVVLVACGPLTNVALFVSVYPELLDGIEEIVFMGGGVGLGNRSAAAEFNILCDPEAAQIVLDAPIRKTMIPLNVTHTAILTRALHRRLLSPSSSPTADDSEDLPPAATPLRHTLSTLVGFFAETYASTFGFAQGPPLHDALTVAHVARPGLFAGRRLRVDVERGGEHTAGETVVDVWGYRACDESWGRNGRNCVVAERVDVDGFFEFFLECVRRCDKSSPLNRQ